MKLKVGLTIPVRRGALQLPAGKWTILRIDNGDVLLTRAFTKSKYPGLGLAAWRDVAKVLPMVLPAPASNW